MKSLVGQTLKNRYQIEEHLGRGGMAEVYKVWDNHRSTILAMKVMHEDLAVDKVFMRRFRREADTLARLQHPNIVRFYGLEEEGRLAFMLLDYIDGDNLKLKIFDAAGPYPSADILQVMQGVCQALAYAHKEGLIHNDIKPGNIMINQHGQVLLADFGIARLADAATATMVGAGTPAYMAPEQVKGLDPVPQTDIYALGIVLYEMLTGGERPFTGEQATTTGTTSAKVRWEQVNLTPPSPREYNPDISPALEDVVLKCLAKNPDQRYQTALDLLNALERAIGFIEDPEPQSAAAVLTGKIASSFTQSSPQKSIGTITQAPWYKGWPFWLGLIAVAAISLAVYSGVGNINYHPEPVIETIPVAALVENAVAETEEPGQVDAGYVTDTPGVVPSPTMTETTTPVPTPTQKTVGTINNPIRLLFVPSVDVNFMKANGKLMAQDLFDITGLYFDFSVPTTYAATIEEICANPENSVGFIPAMGYALANRLCGVEPALASVRYGWNVYWTAFYVARDSAYQSLEDLEGATWAYPDETSTSGFVIPDALFESLNIKLGKRINAGGHPQSVLAVYGGNADFGTAYFSPPLLPIGSWSMGMDPDVPENLVDSCGLTSDGKLYCGNYRVLDARAAISSQAPDVIQKVRILALSPEIPNDTVSFSRDFPDELKGRVMDGITEYVNSPACYSTICSERFYDWTGVAPIYDENFDIIRLLMDYLGITLDNIGG